MWILRKAKERKISAAEMKFLRSVQDYSLLDKEQNVEVRQELGIQSSDGATKEYRRGLCEHLNCMSPTKLQVAVLTYQPIGRRVVGRQRHRWVPKQDN